ncbi:MAG: NADP-dependent isocitrate dehydrogenase, partial [Flavobacteriaceae bacterium]|nr:NADP-dependent isocitrate dehydrogenase [Flavobacteriaceae bacterium]
TNEFLEEGRSPSRKVGELDNRGSHFYLAMYWAKALSLQLEDMDLKEKFVPVYEKMKANENQIIQELNEIQGKSVEIGGYYNPNEEMVSQEMRPNRTLNEIISEI